MQIDNNMDGYANNFTFVKAQEFRLTKSASSVFLMWRLTINFLYYFGVTPFKCEFSVDNGKLYLKTSLFHKVWVYISFVKLNVIETH